MKNVFYFSISANFESDYNVANFEKIVGLTATKLTPLAESKGPRKLAKYYFKSKEFEDEYADELFEKFIEKISINADAIKQEIENNAGDLAISVVFTKLTSKPCSYLSAKVINLLSELGASYDVDFA